MLRYNTEDIVKKALSLADLQNSDFITYEENVFLLNDAYMKLYQNAINVGDELYIKSLVLSSPIDTDERKRVYSLPSDFYQLYSVKCSVLGKDKRPLFRKVKDGSMFDSSYELRNDTIIIYGELLNEVEIEYYPVPATLFLEGDNISISTAGDIPIAYFDNKVVSYSPKNFRVNVFNIDNNISLISWPLFTKEEGSVAPDPKISIIRALAGDNGVVVFYMQDNIKKYLYGTWDNPTAKISSALMNDIPVKQDDGVFVMTAPSKEIISMLITDDSVFEIRKKTIEDENFEELNGIRLEGTENVIQLLRGDLLFISNKEGQVSIYNTRMNTMEVLSNRFEKVISVGEFSISNGRGFLVNKEGMGYIIKTPFRNTRLDYPNNIYFTLMAYALAMSYKIKQNADVSGLTLSYNETLDQYFNMFKRDANAPLRMNNIYR